MEGNQAKVQPLMILLSKIFVVLVSIRDEPGNQILEILTSQNTPVQIPNHKPYL